MLFWAQVLYNKLLSNPASLSHTEQYWSLVIFGQASLCSVPTATNSGRYSPVQLLHSVSTRLLFKECCLLSTMIIFNGLICKRTLNAHTLYYSLNCVTNPRKSYARFTNINSSIQTTLTTFQ